MDIMKIVKVAAPFLGTALSFAGPGGVMASGLITRALGLKQDASHDEIAQAIIGATPEQITALKSAENAFALQMRQIDISSVEEMTKLMIDDTKDARAMKMSTKSIYPEILSTVLILAYITFSLLTFFRTPPAGSQTAITEIMELTKDLTLVVVTFWLGSSRGSADKTALLAKAEPIKS